MNSQAGPGVPGRSPFEVCICSVSKDIATCSVVQSALLCLRRTILGRGRRLGQTSPFHNSLFVVGCPVELSSKRRYGLFDGRAKSPRVCERRLPYVHVQGKEVQCIQCTDQNTFCHNHVLLIATHQQVQPFCTASVRTHACDVVSPALKSPVTTCKSSKVDSNHMTPLTWPYCLGLA